MKRIIQTESAPKAVGPYSQAVEANGMLFISGQIPIDPATGKIVEGGIREQTEQVMKNIGVILQVAGYNYKDVVKSTCLLNDMDNFAAMNEIYSRYYPEDSPARAAYGVVRLPLGRWLRLRRSRLKAHNYEDTCSNTMLYALRPKPLS
jgi:2-iminobutanoate/2-iminopropanoate deaminase